MAYIENIDLLIIKINEFKNQLLLAFPDDGIVKLLNPAEQTKHEARIKSLEDQMKKLKPDQLMEMEELKSQIRTEMEAYGRLIQVTKGNLNTLLEAYDDYMVLLKKNAQLILKIRDNVSKFEAFWKDELSQMYFTIQHNDALSSAFQSTTTNDFMTRAEYYISADLGLAGMCFGYDDNWGLKTIQPYLGVNFNLFPINRQAHYNLFTRSKRQLPYEWVGRTFRSTSLMMGITTRNVGLDIYESNEYVKPLWEQSNVMILTGVGFRVSDYVRLSFGSTLYRYRSSFNPLDQQQYKLGASFYFSLSLDWDVRSFIRNVGSGIFPGILNPQN
jgi:hypothetical protein